GFDVQVADPFNVRGQYPQLRHGAPVVVEHTYAGLTTRLYTGYIVSDPGRGYSGETASVEVECAGPLEVAKSRGDVGFTFTDADPSVWFANKRSPHCFSFDNSDRVAVTVGDNVKVPYDRAGMIGAVAYNGSTHLCTSDGGPLNGWRRITGTASWNLKDNMKAALVWWPKYRVNLDVSDYNVIKTWSPGTTGKDKVFDCAFAAPSGAGYVALWLYSAKQGGTKTTDERFIELDDVVLYTDVAQKTIDQAMLAVAQFTGLATGYDTSPIGNLMKSLVVRPSVDPSSALAALAQQASELVEWGYWDGRFRARPLPTDPNVIRTLPNCYLLDASDGDVLWDVRLRPDTGTPRSVRLIYGHTGTSIWPAGSPATVIGPTDPGWTTGSPFTGVTAPVVTIDFSQRRYTAEDAKKLAGKLAGHLGIAEASGPVGLRCPTVPVYSGGTRPAPYVKGGDWVDSEEAGHGPLYVTRARVDAASGYVDMEVGLSSDALIEQLQAAGSVKPVPLHKPYRRRQ
ncbi:MAG: hypothetical protein GX595_16535, partial [Lentisphaerae bacterium]|nr:hypothetical protein [Lentisphaerota bacterium]